MSCGKENCEKKGTKVHGPSWGLILVLSVVVIAILVVAEQNPVGEILSPKAVAKINSATSENLMAGVTQGTHVATVEDTGDAYKVTKAGRSETWNKSVTVEFKDGVKAETDYTVKPAPVTKEQAEKIEKAVKEVAKAEASKPVATKEVIKTNLVRKDPPPIKH